MSSASEDDNDMSSVSEADNDMSSVSEADSTATRRFKLNKLARDINFDQLEHLRAIKRKAQKRLHNAARRNNGADALHLQELVDDMSAALNMWAEQTRCSNGTFGRTSIRNANTAASTGPEEILG